MKETKRAVRRSHRARLFKKHYKEALHTPRCSDEGREEWAARTARARVNTRTLCSCWMCGNQRRLEGDTFQERRSKDSMNDDLRGS